MNTFAIVLLTLLGIALFLTIVYFSIKYYQEKTNPARAQILDFIASPSNVSSGSNFTMISWKTQNADSLILTIKENPSFQVDVSSKALYEDKNVTQSQTYVLTATNSYNQTTATAEAPVTYTS